MNAKLHRANLLSASFALFLCFGLIPGIACNRNDAGPTTTESTTTPDVSELTAAEFISQLDFASPDKLVASEIEKAVVAAQNNADSPSVWGHLGMMLLAHDFFQPAALCLNHAGKLDDRNPRWPYFESIAVQDFDAERSLKKLQEAVQLFGPAELTPQLRLAEKFLDLDRQSDAEPVLVDIFRIDPNNVGARLLNAKLCLSNNDPAGCLENLKKAGIENKATREMVLLAAESNRRLGNIDAAESLSQRALQVPDIDRPDAILAAVQQLRVGLTQRLKQADSLFVQNRVEESVRLLRSVVIDFPDSEWANVLLARGLIRMRQLEEARVTLDKVISLNPNSFQAHFRLGVLHQVKGEFELASKWFRKTIVLRPDAAVAYNNLGQCQFALGDTTGAEKSYNRAIEVQPNYFDGQLRLVEFYARINDFESASKFLDAARKLQPENPRVLHATGLLEREQRNEAQ